MPAAASYQPTAPSAYSSRRQPPTCHVTSGKLPSGAGMVRRRTPRCSRNHVRPVRWCRQRTRYVGEGLIGTGGGLWSPGASSAPSGSTSVALSASGSEAESFIDGGAIRLRRSPPFPPSRAPAAPVPAPAPPRTGRRPGRPSAAPARGAGDAGLPPAGRRHGRLPALYFFFAVHSIPSFSKAVRSRCRVRNREDFTFLPGAAAVGDLADALAVPVTADEICPALPGELAQEAVEHPAEIRLLQRQRRAVLGGQAALQLPRRPPSGRCGAGLPGCSRILSSATRR